MSSCQTSVLWDQNYTEIGIGTKKYIDFWFPNFNFGDFGYTSIFSVSVIDRGF